MKTIEERIKESKENANVFTNMVYESLVSLSKNDAEVLKIKLADFLYEQEQVTRAEVIADFREAIRKVEAQ